MDRTIDGFEGLEAAQNAIKDNGKKDAFAVDYKYVSKLWESLSPDRVLDLFTADYRWMTSVYVSVSPANPDLGKVLWSSLGTMTTELIQKHIHVGKINQLNEFVLDADVVEEIFNNPDPKKAKAIEKELIKRFNCHAGNPKFKKLSERLEELRDKAEQGLISSIEFIKELCKIARDTVVTEKEMEGNEKTPQVALTELFLELKTDQTPVIIERIVADIDAIVRKVRFVGWQNSTAGEREVRKSLRQALRKYSLDKNHDLFEQAYGYIREYY